MIQKEEQQYEHINYKEYKHKLKNKNNDNLILFISSFFIMLIIFLGIAKQLSPDVDVTIEPTTEQITENTERGIIDERLKMIHMEDNTPSKEDEIFTPELDEKINLPTTSKRKIIGSDEEFDIITLKKENPQEKTTEAEKNDPSTQAPIPTQSTNLTNAKVIVGYYATAEQAEVAKSIILDAGLNIEPFIKNIGGAYTLQVASFSSRETAQSVANELLKNNFPARVIIE